VTRKPLIFAAALLLVISACAFGQDAGLSNLPSYKPEHKIAGAIRCFGSDLKGQVAAWQAGFLKYHPDAVFANNFMTSSEGAMAGLYTGLSDVAPAGDDAKITDQMPFFNTFRYLPLELSVATGGYEKRGTLWAIQIVVNKQNPISHLTMKQLDGIFGSERTGGWEGIEYTSKYARGPEQNVRTWGQLGLTGEWANQPIRTYGYIAPGFVIAFERKVFHWSDKWNPNYREFVEAKETTQDNFGQAVASERMLEELSKDKYGIAWAAVMHTKDYPEVKGIALAVQDNGPFVDLTPENVRNRTYPLIRDAYIYLNRTPARPLDAKVKEFMRYILSREGQEDVLRLGVYNPLTPEALAEQLKKLD
jgi:phosphate transport system substrate-binding protein